MSDNVKDVKRKLRNQYKQYRLALSADVKADYDKKICEALVQLVSFKYSDTISMKQHIRRINLELYVSF